MLNTATMTVILAGSRPSWWVPVTIGLAVLSAACLTATIGISASIAARALRPAVDGGTPSARPDATTGVSEPPSATSTALEVRTAVDPWAGPDLTPERSSPR